MKMYQQNQQTIITTTRTTSGCLSYSRIIITILLLHIFIFHIYFITTTYNSCSTVHSFTIVSPSSKNHNNNNNINSRRIIQQQEQQSKWIPTSHSPLFVATTSTIPTESSSMFFTNTNTGLTSIEQQQQQQQPRVGVLLLNLGGPETGDDVEGFLYNLFADPDIIRLPTILSPLQNLIAYIIARRRAPKSRAAYDSIGGGSPILQYSRQQAQLIAKSIQERYNISIHTYIGMRYWHPFTEEALLQIEKDQIDALVIVPLYPQFSISTSGSSLRLLQEEFAKQSSASSNGGNNNGVYRNMIHTVVPSWYNRPGYVNAMSLLIQKEINSFTAEEIQYAITETPNEKPIHILFSAHGVPKSYIDAGDPYQQQIIDCVDAISKSLPLSYNNTVEVHLSYQSRVGPIEWLRPYTDDVLPALGERGVKNLVVVPISFVSEHIETLEEIDIEYRELAEESGICHWKRCPALNTDVNFITDMGDMIIEALNEPIQTVTEACIANMVSDLMMMDDDILNDADSKIINVVGVQGVGRDASTSTTISTTQVVDNENNSNNNNARSSSNNVDTPLSSFTKTGMVLQQQETLYARIAMISIAMVLVLELLYKQSIIQLVVSSTTTASIP